ncbi:formate/nitrite transporter family protein [Blastococcus sp. PRF04-17]|uniref:formate/nitrite transporter family protein n=1 Tax=Blastococcus sp. PRF04-17 TaxID=2933797 RepID=UPI001FF22221|nr:formate/nitrite transporter family protein [Blastococcus sp. PRF04-17]UOY00481.1 formate/nitrite transporter family protein [Blastococcus sp. PRF04-17]
MPETVEATAASAAAKAAAVRRPPSYLVSAVLAGCYVGMAVVLLVSVSAPLAAAGSPVTKLVQGAVFGLALTLVVFAGAELFTGNVMVMTHGLRRRTVGYGAAATVNVVSLIGNAIGSLALALAVTFSGVLRSGATADAGSPAHALLSTIVAAKNQATGPELFWRAVLCNALVCLALWMAARATSDGAKLMVLWWGLLAFIGSGFEHSVANMTTFSLAIFDGLAAWSDLGHNLAWTIPGNVVGGLLVAFGYAWTVQRRPTVPEQSIDLPVAALPEQRVGARA